MASKVISTSHLFSILSGSCVLTVCRWWQRATTIPFPRPRLPTHWSAASPQAAAASRKSFRTRPLSQTPSHAAATFSTITGGDSQSLTSSSEAVEPPPSHHHRQTPSITSSSTVAVIKFAAPNRSQLSPIAQSSLQLPQNRSLMRDNCDNQSYFYGRTFQALLGK